MHTPLDNGYGAKQVLAWLVTGRLYDDGRFPVVSLLVAAGVVTCVVRWRADSKGRPVVAAWVMSLLLSFGRTTFGGLTVLLPGSKDIFMRRFMMGAQLSGLLLAGIGAVAVARALSDAVSKHAAERRRPGVPVRAARRRLSAGGAGHSVLLSPWPCCGRRGPRWGRTRPATPTPSRNSTAPSRGTQADQLIAYVQAHGGGRVYAGMPSNWGEDFGVGAVPVFKYLESQDVDEVGYTLRTASL